MKDRTTTNKLTYHYTTILSKASLLVSFAVIALFLMFGFVALVICAPVAFAADTVATPTDAASEEIPSTPTDAASEETPSTPTDATSEEIPTVGSERIIEETRVLSVALTISPALFQRGNEAVAALFEPTLRYEEDGFFGDLALVTMSYTPMYRVEQRQIERVMHYPGLPDKDIIYIPIRSSFEVASAEAIGATATVELEMTAVEWTHEGYDAAGRPQGFTAEVTYRGVESALIYDHFVVTATYGGIVTKTIPIDAPVEPPTFTPPVDTIETDPIEDPIEDPIAATPEGPGTGDSMTPLVIVTTSVAVVLFGCLAFALFFWYWNVRLIVIREDGSTKTVLRKHVRLVDGTARLTIPDRCIIMSPDARHLLRLKQSLVSKGGFLSLVWRNCLLFHLPLEREIDLRQRFAEISVSDLVLESIEGKTT